MGQVRLSKCLFLPMESGEKGSLLLKTKLSLSVGIASIMLSNISSTKQSELVSGKNKHF